METEGMLLPLPEGEDTTVASLTVQDNTGLNLTHMSWFKAFRGDFGYSNYGEHRTSVTSDVPLVAVVYACVLFSIAALVAAAGIRGKERWYTLIRLVYCLAVGSIVLVSIFGYCWQIGYVRVHSPYIYRTDGQMSATLGVRLGLQTINITLSGTFKNEKNTFDYNEEVQLEDVVSHRPELWHAVDRGLPSPLLTILEYFDVDDGGLRFGRSSRMAGYFANILLWTAFAFWVTANVLLCSVVWYGACCFTLTGVCMVLASFVYNYLSPDLKFRMPCADSDLVMSYGWCFWSVLVFGILTTLTGLLLFALDQYFPKKLAEFFLLEIALENLQEDPKYQQLTTNTPRKVDRQSELKPLPSSVNWFVNSGFTHHDPVHKTNPLFERTGSEVSLANSEPFEVPRSRVRKSGLADSERSRSQEDVSLENAMNDEQLTKRRLSEIYVDMEPGSPRGVASIQLQGRIFGQELHCVPENGDDS